VIHKAGHVVHLWCEPTVTRYQNKIIEINGIIVNVTERRRMEEALRESEEKYRTMTENINVGIYRNTPGIEGCFIEANSAIARILGYNNKSEFLNTKVAAHYQNPEDRKKFDRKMARKKLVQNEVLLLKKKDGIPIWGAVTVKAICDDKGNVIFYDGVIEDITERKRIEEALRKSEERYRHFVGNSSEGIWRIEFARPIPLKISENEIIRQMYEYGYIAECNEVLAKMYGFSSVDAVKGKRLVDLHGGPDNPDNIKAYRNLIRSGFRIVDAETQEVDNLGNVKYFLNNVTGIIEGDYILGSWGTQRDITKRKLTEERMKASLKEREVLLKEVHHRVKNNMQVISSLLHLQSQNIKNEEDLAMFKESQDRVRSMALVHDKLYRSRDFTKIDFAGYIKSLASGLYQSYGIDQRGVSLNIRVKDVSLGIDLAIPCGLIINELVSNTLKHAFPTTWKGRPKILISLTPAGDNEIELVVQDNGVGIPKDIDLQKIESLGLKLVAILTEDQLGGKVRLDRTKGTEFQIKFKREIAV
jgi:PAS domain S-box-containing protein